MDKHLEGMEKIQGLWKHMLHFNSILTVVFNILPIHLHSLLTIFEEILLRIYHVCCFDLVLRVGSECLKLHKETPQQDHTIMVFTFVAILRSVFHQGQGK